MPTRRPRGDIHPLMAEDEPHFPPPGTGAPTPTDGGYRTAAAPAPTPRAAVVHRPAAGPDDAPAALSREEMRALIAVTAATAPTLTPRKRAWRRGRVILLPFGLAQTAAHAVLGAAAPWVMGAVFLAGVAWVAHPLLKKDRFADVD